MGKPDRCVPEETNLAVLIGRMADRARRQIDGVTEVDRVSRGVPAVGTTTNVWMTGVDQENGDRVMVRVLVTRTFERPRGGQASEART
jgi:hypothetical protein